MHRKGDSMKKSMYKLSCSCCRPYLEGEELENILEVLVSILLVELEEQWRMSGLVSVP